MARASRPAPARLPLGAVALGLALALLEWPAGAQLVVPQGFTAELYVTGQGFDSGGERAARGFPGAASLAVDGAGTLYLGRLGARFRQGEVDDLVPLYRIPPGGGRLTPETEASFMHGPPLPSSMVGSAAGTADLLVTTFDRDRRLGAVYRILDGRARLFAGGTPTDRAVPILRQPEGAVADPEGSVYVADRERNAVVRLDPSGRLLDSEWVRVPRPRFLAIDGAGTLWVAADGTAETPIQDGSGRILRVGPDGKTTLLLEGPLPSGLAVSPGGALFVSQRRTGQLFAVTADGRRLDFGGGSDGHFLRGIAFVPVSPATLRAGLAGDLLVIVARRQSWMLSEVYRVSGPFDQFVGTGR